MKRFLLPATLLTASLAPAQVLWDRATFGMSEASIRATYGPKLEVSTPKSGEYLRAYSLNRRLCNMDLEFSFIIGNESRRLDWISAMTAGGTVNSSGCIEDALTAKYGRPVRSGSDYVTIPDVNTVWIHNGVKVTLRRFRGVPVQVKYEKVDSSAL